MLRKEISYTEKHFQYIHAVFNCIYLHALFSSSEFVLKLSIIVTSRLCSHFSTFFMSIVYLLSFNDVVLVQPVRLIKSYQTFDMMCSFLWNFQVTKWGFFSSPKFKFECIAIGTDDGISLHTSAQISENYYAYIRK